MGRAFKSREEIELAIKSYDELNYCNLRKRDVRTLKAASKRCTKRVSTANSALEYVSMTYTSKFSGYPEKRENRKRNTKSFRQGCPSEINFGLSEDGQTLVIKKINETHNHLISAELCKPMPRQRILPDSLTENVNDAISLKSNSKLLQQKNRNLRNQRYPKRYCKHETISKIRV